MAFAANAAVTHKMTKTTLIQQIKRQQNADNCKTAFQTFSPTRMLNCPLSGCTFRFRRGQLMPLYRSIGTQGDDTVMCAQLESIAVQTYYISPVHQKKATAGSRKIEAH